MQYMIRWLRIIENHFPLFFLTFLGIYLLAYFNLFLSIGEQQFSYLAKSFAEGKLYFTQEPGSWIDSSFFNGKYYWPLGPFPAILLTPFAFLFGVIKQGYVHFIINILNFTIAFKIAKKIIGNNTDAWWLSFGYIFGSQYFFLSLFPWSWWYAQILSHLLLITALYLYLNKKNYLLIGIFIATAFLTRTNLILATIFFILLIIFDNTKTHIKIKNLTLLITPILSGLFFYGLYNYLRFNNPVEQGYNLQLLHYKQLAANRSFGLWSLVHFPSNLYHLFLAAPEGKFIPGTKIIEFPFLKPNVWGMSIILTSPLLLWIFKAKWRVLEVKIATLTSLALLISILGYYGIGVNQYGYRYALDFSPFLYLILVYTFRNGVSNLFKIVVCLTFLISLYLIPLTFLHPIDLY